ncbi:hypothetical protein C9E88_003365 [Acinetobacter cumulans]|jgi:hypothetical protein|nr:hypothetical protein [Acinetobacter cumulans]QCO20625.1 hypothetical protein C9E88_003365 [Acinetobacter cumulans]
MKLFKRLNVCIYSLLIASVGAFSISNANVIEASDVHDCKFDFDSVNFCEKKYLELYNKILKEKKSNFYNNKYVDSFKYNGNSYFFVIELSKSKVYTLPVSVTSLKSIKNVDFENNNNVLCLSGNVNQFQNSYRKSKVCYQYENGDFKLKSTELLDGVSSKNKNTDVKEIILPTSSDYFINCSKMNSTSKCEKLSSIENHVYMLNDIKSMSPEIVGIFNNQKIKNLNLDGIKFLPSVGGSQYIIGEKYQDTDNDSNTFFYLLKIKPNVDVKNIGSFYSIDKNFNLFYKDESGNNKNLKLD